MGRSARDRARRRADRRGRAGWRDRRHRRGEAGVWRAHRRWPVRRLLGLSRAADGADAGGGDRGLVALAAVRQRRGGAVGALGGLSFLYAIDPARRGLAMAQPSPARTEEDKTETQQLKRN